MTSDRKYRIRIIVVFVLALGFQPKAWPVTASDEEPGQALIFPVFSAAAGNASLLTIVNGHHVFRDHEATAVKVRVLGGSGDLMASFNLYLGSQDTWVASIANTDDVTTLSSPDNSCVLPAPQSGVIATLPEAIGSIEVIEMGAVVDFETGQAIHWKDCAVLQSRWETGAWATDPAAGLAAPLGNLAGFLNLVHVEKGTAYSFRATALAGFSDIVQHTAADAGMPDLASAHDAGTETAQGTAATVCFQGRCETSHWDTPIEAVSAALMKQELQGDFVRLESIAARTEWVIAYPTRRYAQDLPSFSDSAALFLIDREGEGMSPPCILPIPPYICHEHYNLQHTRPVEVVVFGNDASEFGSQGVSPILGLPYTVRFPTNNGAPVPPAGIARLGFNSRFLNADGGERVGFPAIGYVLQEYTNAFLPGNDGQLQRANYGMATPATAVIDQGEP